MKLLLALSLLGIVWCTSAQNVSTADCTLTEKTVDCVMCNEEGTCRNTHKEAGPKTTYETLSGKTCEDDGCRVCTSGPNNKYRCTFERKESAFGPKFCVSSGSSRCPTCSDAECHMEVTDNWGPGKRSAEEKSSSSICNDNGHTKTCTTCVNGVCNTETTRHGAGKRGIEIRKCWGSGYKKICVICPADGISDCRPEEIHTSRPGKRSSSSEHCHDDGIVKTCTTCVDGVCNTKVTRGKRGTGDTRTCVEDNGLIRICTVCPADGSKCYTERKHLPGKRSSSAFGDNTSTTCDNNGCTVCVNGNCHHQNKRAIAEEEEQIVHTSTNCGPLGCVICNNGSCHLQPGKRAANGSYSKSCNNGKCVECTNGNCRHYNE